MLFVIYVKIMLNLQKNKIKFQDHKLGTIILKCFEF
jgi:hypothetical protein